MVRYIAGSTSDCFADYPHHWTKLGVHYDNFMISVGYGTFIAYSYYDWDGSRHVRFGLQLKGSSFSLIRSLHHQLIFAAGLAALDINWSCSRFDIALDDWWRGAFFPGIDASGIDPHFLFEQCPGYLSGPRSWLVIESSGKLDSRASQTLQLGSRESFKYWRIYQKRHDCHLFSLRYELEAKQGCSRSLFAEFLDAGSVYITRDCDRPELLQHFSRYLRGSLFGSFDFRVGYQKDYDYDSLTGEYRTLRLLHQGKNLNRDRCSWWQAQLDRLLDGAQPLKIPDGRSKSTLAANLIWHKRSVYSSLAVYYYAMGSDRFFPYLASEFEHYRLLLSNSGREYDLAKFEASVAFVRRAIFGDSDSPSPDLAKFNFPESAEHSIFDDLFENRQIDLLADGLASPGLGFLSDYPYDISDFLAIPSTGIPAGMIR
ncbi:MAG: hypothetical protein J7525_14075 [Roseofilum sp. SID3]|uniref:hypothetical protein n=1 Tax=Roseofilum sp. SID3 TaxID=2821499 RepID=UPI001B1EDB40|nr:hypothetical protein [Roseofilum sp. SID3]MBP0014220.1 hypothetical protein [Roseofilum sp. SID3]